MKKIRALTLALTLSLSMVSGAVAKAVEPPILTWQAPPMVAPGFDATYLNRIDNNTPFYMSDDGKVRWNPDFFSIYRTKENHKDSTLSKIGQTEIQGLTARQVSDLLSRNAGDTILLLHPSDPKTPSQLKLDQLQAMIKKSAPGGIALNFNYEGGTVNRSPDYRFASMTIPSYNEGVSSAATIHSFATAPYKDGDTPPLDCEGMSITRALQFADNAGYFALGDELIEKAEKISGHPLGDFATNTFEQFIQTPKYLASTGRIEAADTIYRNLLKTAYNWGVQPVFCSNVLLEYATFLKYQGREKEAEPYYKELEFRGEGGKRPDLCYGMAGNSNGNYFELQQNFAFFQEHHFWAPVKRSAWEFGAEGADKDSPLNAVGRVIYTKEIGRDKNWQSAYQAYRLIMARNFAQADEAVQTLLQVEQSNYSHGANDISRLINLAGAYAQIGEKEKAHDLRVELLPLTAEPLQGANREELLFELAYSAKSDTSLSDQYWKLLESTVHDSSDHFPDLSTRLDQPTPAPAPSEEQRAQKVIQLLSNMTDMYLAYDQPDKAFFVIEQEQKRHNLTPHEKLSSQLKLARVFAKEKQFDKAAALIQPIIDDKRTSELCYNHEMADTISEIRLQNNLPLAKRFASEAALKIQQFDEPLYFQLGLINLQERDYVAAEKNLSIDFKRQDLGSSSKANIVCALIKAQMAQGKYDAAFDTLIEANKNNILQSHAKEMLIEVISHIDKMDQDRLMPFFVAIARDSGQITDVGHATQLQQLKQIADSKTGLPPMFAQAVAEWRAGYYPEAKRPQAPVAPAKAIISLPEKDSDAPVDAYALLRRAQLKLTMGETGQAVEDIFQSVKTWNYPNYLNEQSLQLQKLTELGRLADVEKLRIALVDTRSGDLCEGFRAQLATFYIQQREYAKAESCVSDGMRVLATATGKLNTNYATQPWLNTARAYAEGKKYADAMKILNDVQNAQNRWFGPMNSLHKETLLTKANIEHLMGNEALARKDAQSALRITMYNDGLPNYAMERKQLSQQHGPTFLSDHWSEQNSLEAAQLPALNDLGSSYRYLRSPKRSAAEVAEQEEIYEKAKRDGKLGMPEVAAGMELSAYRAVKQKDYNQAHRDLGRALSIQEQIEGKCNLQRSILMLQLACVDALDGKKSQAQEWRKKARLAQTKTDNNETKLKSAAYDACASALIGDKASARLKALEVLEASPPLNDWELYDRPSVEVLKLIGQKEEAQKWTQTIDDRKSHMYVGCGNAVRPPATAMIELLIKAD